MSEKQVRLQFMREFKGEAVRQGRCMRVRRLQLWPRFWAFPRPVRQLVRLNVKGELCGLQGDDKLSKLLAEQMEIA